MPVHVELHLPGVECSIRSSIDYSSVFARPPYRPHEVRIFLSSSSRDGEGRFRAFIKRLVDDSFNQVIRSYSAALAVDGWAWELPHDAPEGETNADNIELAKQSHLVCVLLFEWVGPGTVEEVEAVLAMDGEKPRLAVFRFTGGSTAQPSDDAVPVQDFLRQHKDHFTWSEDIDSSDLDGAFVRLTQPVASMALWAASHGWADRERNDVYH